MARAASKELTKRNGNGNGNGNAGIIPFDSTPDYLPAGVKHTGMEAMGSEDFKTPRIILLQGLSPELELFDGLAKKDHFWHSGMNVSLGTEFDFVPVIANKRVILWRPRDDQNGGILAFSKNGKTWDNGANQTFSVKLKHQKQPVLWKTGKDVLSSKLTEFGTSDPDNPQSAPAASVVFEYLAYLPQHPELSPVVLGVSKTGLKNGRSFNTSLGTIARTGKPISCVTVRCFVEQVAKDGNKWTVPNFKLLGWATPEVYKVTQKLAETYADYETEYKQEEASAIDDTVPY